MKKEREAFTGLCIIKQLRRLIRERKRAVQISTLIITIATRVHTCGDDL